MTDYAIAPPQSKSNQGFAIAPPTSNLFQDYQAAGNAADMESLLTRATGTTLEPSIKRSALIMGEGSKPVQNILDASNSKGGVQTADGRIALAAQAHTCEGPCLLRIRT